METAHRKGFTLMKAKRTESAFTLIELLVVVSIIGLLATLITANLTAARGRSRDAVRKADLKNMQTALRLYYNDEAGYPSSITTDAALTSKDGDIIYMNLVPSDPLPDQSYGYVPDSASDTFTLSACLENESDKNCGTAASGSVPSGWECPSGCVYQIKP